MQRKTRRDCFPYLIRSDDLVVFCHEQGVDIVKTADIFQSFFQSEQVAVSAECVALHGRVREDCDTEKVILDRITSCRIKDVVIDCPVFFNLSNYEIAFVAAGGNDRSVTFPDRGKNFVYSAERFLDTDSEQ